MVAQLLGRAHEGERLPGGRAVGQGLVARGSVERRRPGTQLAMDPAVAQDQRHLAGQHDGLVAGGGQQATGEKLLDRRLRGGHAHLAPGVGKAAGGRAPGELVEGGPRLGGDVVQQAPDDALLGQQGGEALRHRLP